MTAEVAEAAAPEAKKVAAAAAEIRHTCQAINMSKGIGLGIGRGRGIGAMICCCRLS